MKKEISTTRKQTRIGWTLSILAILFLSMDAIGKFIKPEEVVTGTLALGYPESVITGLGIVLLLSTIIYAIPRVSFLGAILLTGYLGGAIASHVRLGNPLFSHTLFPVYVAIFVWLGLYLRNTLLRRMFFGQNEV